MQDNAEERSIEIVNAYEKKHRCEFMRYSLLWTAFHSIMNSDYEMGRSRRYPLKILGSSRTAGNNYINWGVQNKYLKQMFQNKGIKCLNLRLTSARVGLRRGDTLAIPLHRSARKLYTGKRGLDNNFSTLMDNMSHDEQYFRNIISGILKMNKPRFIMMNEDRTKFARLLVEEAHKNSITVFVIQHGLTPATPHNHIPFANESFAPLNADYICAWGDQSREYLIRNGVSKERIAITGNGAINREAADIRSNTVTVIDQQFIGQRDEMEYTYRGLINALNKAHIDYRIYLRGTYNAQYLERIAPDRIRHWEKGAIRDIMRKSRAVIGFYSTAIIEAALQNTHVIAYDALHRGDVMNFGSAGIEVYNSSDDLISAVGDTKALHYKLDEIIHSYGRNADINIFNTIMEKI